MITVGTITEILAALGADPQPASDRVRAKCPLARWTHPKGSDSTPSFVAFPRAPGGDDVPIYSCSSCHEKGRLEDLLLFLWSKGLKVYPLLARITNDTEKASPIQNVPPLEAARRRVQSIGAIVPRPKRVSRFDMIKAAMDAVVELPREQLDRHPLIEGDTGWRYLKIRGFSAETMMEWQFGHDSMRKRVIFPFFDHHGRLVALSGRLYACPRCGTVGPRERREYRCTSCKVELAEGLEACPSCGGEPVVWRKVCAACKVKLPPKYMHSNGFKRNLFLYGENLVEKGGSVYVVEGNLDAPAMWQEGLRPVVAVLGTAIGDVQAEKLVRWWDRIIAVGDGDEAGRKLAGNLRSSIAGRVPVVSRSLPEGMDPAAIMRKFPGRLQSILV